MKKLDTTTGRYAQEPLYEIAEKINEIVDKFNGREYTVDELDALTKYVREHWGNDQSIIHPSYWGSYTRTEEIAWDAAMFQAVQEKVRTLVASGIHLADLARIPAETPETENEAGIPAKSTKA